MKTTLLTIVAILLAIPTFGISLIVWIFIKYKYDKFIASRVLINAAVMSYERNGNNEVRYAVNNAALPMVFEMFRGKVITEIGNTVSGILLHPIKNIPLVVTMTQMSDNSLFIKATGV